MGTGDADECAAKNQKKLTYMELTKAQSQIAKDTTRFRVLNCGRRFGKTTLAIWEILGKALSKADNNIVYVAPTYQQARDIAWRDLIKICEPVIEKVNESRLEITIKTTDGGTSRISFRGWESIETLRGQRYDFIVIDEVAMMRDFWAHWEEVIRPTLTDTKGECLFISTPKGFNHFYDLYLKEGKDKNYKSFHFTSYDNSYIPKEEIDAAKAELAEDSFAQEYMADFRKQEGLVYKEFNRDKHTFDEMPQKRLIETIVGVDFGFTNPAAVLTIKKDFDNTYYVVDEWYKTGKTDSQIAEYCDSIDAQKFFPDPENPGGIKELSDRGLNVIEVVKGKGSVERGIDRVRHLLRTNKLKISKNCIALISELETYRYEEKRPNKNEPEKPVKENDHALDALRYALVMDESNSMQRRIQNKRNMMQTRFKNRVNIVE